jgi:cytochrome c5
MEKKFSRTFFKQKIYIVFSIFIMLVACKQDDAKKSVDKNIHTEDSKFVSSVETNLPDAPNADVFKANCITCHSARYVQTQPEFPRKTWEKIVDKMIKNYGAPISDSSAKDIVDYLVAIKAKN